MLVSIYLFFILISLGQSTDTDVPPTNIFFALTTDGQIILVEADGSIIELDIRDEITGIIWSSATGAFATTDLSGKVTIYPVEGEPFIIVEHGFLSLGDWSPDGRFLLMIVAEDNAPFIMAYDMLDDRFVSIASFFDMAFTPYTARWSPDGETIYFDLAGITLNTLSTHCLIDVDALCETEPLYFFDDIVSDEPEDVFLPMVSPGGDELAFVCGSQLMLCIADLETRQIIARIETGRIGIGHGSGLAPRWIGESLYYFQQGTLHRYDILTAQETTLFPVLPLNDTPNYWFWGYIEAEDIPTALLPIIMASE